MDPSRPASARAARVLTAREALLEVGLVSLGRADLGAPGTAYHRVRREGGDEALAALASGIGAEEEARIVGLLEGPGLPRLLEERRGRGFRALVLADPGPLSLARELERRGPLEARRALSIGARLARALGRAHGLGLVHGAILPANVALSPGGPAEATLLGRFADRGAPLRTATAADPAALAATPDGDLALLGRTLLAALAGDPSIACAPPSALAPAALLAARPDAADLAPAARVLERALRLRPEVGYYPDGDSLGAALEAAARRLGEARADITGRFTREELQGLLQMLELQRKSGRIELAAPGACAGGALVLREGRIAAARAGDATGRDALRRLLGLVSGRFRVVFGPVGEGARGVSVSAALLEAARLADEAGRGGEGGGGS